MIAKLTGIVDALSEDGAVIDVGGVGYSVFCSARTLAVLPSISEPATVLIETHVREDHIHLFGFATVTERDWFRLLLTVQGVGAKVALAVLSAFPADELALAIAAEDVATLTRANGVGRKVAQRIAAELRDKAGAVAIGSGAVPAGMAGTPTGAPADAVSALVNLGYRQIEATGAIGHAVKALGGDANAETLIKAGLQELAS